MLRAVKNINFRICSNVWCRTFSVKYFIVKLLQLSLLNYYGAPVFALAVSGKPKLVVFFTTYWKFSLQIVTVGKRISGTCSTRILTFVGYEKSSTWFGIGTLCGFHSSHLCTFIILGITKRKKTPHGVGDISNLYFAILATFKESMTLNLAQGSFKVIHFGGNRKPLYEYIVYSVN